MNRGFVVDRVERKMKNGAVGAALWRSVFIRRTKPFLVFGLMLLTLNVKSLMAGVVINEVLYDPAGSDSGAEWVELYNNGDVSVGLTGWYLQKSDGGPFISTSDAVVANLAGVLAPKAYYLIAESATATVVTPDLISTMSFTNGTTKAYGIRLMNGLAEVDRMVYGSPDSDGVGAEGGTGNEAPSVGSGSSLARVVDGRDTNINKDDFWEDASPTPRAANDPAGIVRSDVSGSISYPNPLILGVNGPATFSTPERILGALREVRIYSVAGELINTLQESQWDGKNKDGDYVSSGLYFYIVITDQGKARGKITVMK